MSKQTFNLARRDGAVQSVSYTPLIVTAGSTTHKLALHKDPVNGAWVVSDPLSGAAVIRQVSGSYKGVRVSSRGYTQKEIRMLAIADVEALIARVGSDRFNAVLSNPKPF